ncbi:MAG: hypothetical protein ACREUW_02130 [Burkholderiales bacterium]
MRLGTLSPAARASFWILEGGSALILAAYAALRAYPWLAARTGGLVAGLLLALAGLPLLAAVCAWLIRRTVSWMTLRARTVTGLILFATLLIALVVPAVQTVGELSRATPPVSR